VLKTNRKTKVNWGKVKKKLQRPDKDWAGRDANKAVPAGGGEKTSEKGKHERKTCPL